MFKKLSKMYLLVVCGLFFYSLVQLQHFALFFIFWPILQLLCTCSDCFKNTIQHVHVSLQICKAFYKIKTKEIETRFIFMMHIQEKNKTEQV